MPHFLTDKNNIKDGYIYVSDADTLNHLVSALRIKPNEIVKFIDEDEIVYRSKVIEVDKKHIKAEIIKSEKSERKLNIDISVVISILKPDGMNLALQNAVQAGAKEIYTVISDNCASKFESINKEEKWQKIGMESFKQCERADIPRVYSKKTFSEVFSKFKKENIIVFAEKYDKYTIKQALNNLNKTEKILLVFGPEGGFSEEEFNYFKKENLKLTTLGPLIFKAPNAVTAGIFGVVQCLMK